MRLTGLHLENYKRIETCDIDLSKPVTALVGRNNSGKSSILNAIYSVAASSGEQGMQINRSMADGVTMVELRFVLSKEEWSQLTKVSGVQNPLVPEQCASFERLEITKSRIWRYANRGLNQATQSLRSEELQNLNTAESNKAVEALDRIANPNLAQIFGVVTLSTAGRRLSQATNFVPYNTLRQGNPLDQFNSWLFHLKRKDSRKYEEFVYEVKSVFPEIETLDVDYDLDTGAVDLRLSESSIPVPGADMGSGWHSMLTLYSYMLSPGFNVLLLDEPDAHMHAGLVRLLARFLVGVSENVQTIVATHNPAFINSLPATSLWYLEDSSGGKSIAKKMESSGDLVSMLRSLGVEVPNEVIPVIRTFENTKAAITLFDGVDSRLDLKRQIVRTATPQALGFFTESELLIPSREFESGSPEYALAEELRACPRGQEGWERYQTICERILSYCFSPPLEKPVAQSSTEGGAQRRDLVIGIPFDVGGFWRWLQDTHNAIAIVVDCKNYTDPLPANEITTVSRYLGERRLGKFGFVLTRIGLQDGALEEVKRLWSEAGIMLVSLDDEDMIEILKIKAHGGRPEKVIDSKYRAFRSSLSR